MKPAASECVIRSDSTSGVLITDLHFQYPGSSFGLSLRQLELGAGETLAILGPSGCGKSTLLRLIAGLLPPNAGKVSIGVSDIHLLNREGLRNFRLKQIGLVFQDFALLDYLTVSENILLPAKLGGFFSDEVTSRVQSLMDQLGIRDHEKKITRMLSQGERQRVAIARALAHEPTLVLADEPTASLDAARRDGVAAMLVSYAKERGAPLIMVTHDAALKDRFDRVVDFQELVS
jgi:putative ABC transport system ATP-binding protein